MKNRMIAMLVFTAAGVWAGVQESEATTSGPAGGEQAAAVGAVDPPELLVLKAYQWIMVPSLPELCDAPTLRLRHVGLLSGGGTAEVGAPDIYLVAEYGSGDVAEVRRAGCRYVILETYRGHSSRMYLHDVDRDGVPELLVEYKTLTDAPRLCIYRFKAQGAELGFMQSLPGLQPLMRGLGKSLVRLFGDGSIELRDEWSADMKRPLPVPRRYVWREGAFQLSEAESDGGGE